MAPLERKVASALLVAAALLASAPAAFATTPGANGRILGVQAVNDEGVPEPDAWVIVDPATGSSDFYPSKEHPYKPFTTEAFVPRPAWAPSDQAVAFVDWAEPQTGPYDNGPRPNDVIVQPLEGGVPSGARRNLTNSPQDEYDVAWSPAVNGQARLAFTRAVGAQTFPSYRGEIWTMDADGGSQRRLTDGPADAEPDWSPDGARIAFTCGTAGNRDIYVIPAAGGTPQRITTTAGDDADPSWSPDGRQLVFVHGAGSSARLWVVDATPGATPHALPGAPAGAQQPAWSPDGTLVAFSVPEAGYPRLATIRPDGTGLKQYGYGQSPSWERINRAPTASFTSAPSAPRAGEAVTFTSTAADPDGALASQTWDLDGDGAFDDGSGATVTFTYAAAGTYAVAVRVVDADGAIDVARGQVTVAAAPGGGNPPQPPQPPTPPTGGVRGNQGSFTARLVGKRNLRVLATTGLRVRVTCPRRCRATLRLTIGSRTARRLGLPVTLARRTVTVPRRVPTTFRLRVDARVGRRIARLAHLRASLRFEAVAGGRRIGRIVRPVMLSR